MSFSFDNAVKRHEIYAATNGALLIFLLFSIKLGPGVLNMVPPGQNIPEIRFLVYGIWALCAAGLVTVQIFLKRSRKRLREFVQTK
jgi:hypothetical protein